jgi:hypothetical protein
MIGIFWVYKKTVIGKAVDVSEGEEYVQGIVDSPDNHTDFWDNDKEYRELFPELRFSEYMAVPRGRVLYSRKDGQAIVYMDKVLFTDSGKRLIVDFFQLGNDTVLWRSDPHYTTSEDELDRLLE